MNSNLVNKINIQNREYYESKNISLKTKFEDFSFDNTEPNYTSYTNRGGTLRNTINVFADTSSEEVNKGGFNLAKDDGFNSVKRNTTGQFKGEQNVNDWVTNDFVGSNKMNTSNNNPGSNNIYSNTNQIAPNNTTNTVYINNTITNNQINLLGGDDNNKNSKDNMLIYQLESQLKQPNNQLLNPNKNQFGQVSEGNQMNQGTQINQGTQMNQGTHINPINQMNKGNQMNQDNKIYSGNQMSLGNNVNNQIPSNLTQSTKDNKILGQVFPSNNVPENINNNPVQGNITGQGNNQNNLNSINSVNQVNQIQNPNQKNSSQFGGTYVNSGKVGVSDFNPFGQLNQSNKVSQPQQVNQSNNDLNQIYNSNIKLGQVTQTQGNQSKSIGIIQVKENSGNNNDRFFRFMDAGNTEVVFCFIIRIYCLKTIRLLI